jgi:cell division protein FtsQ
MRAVPSVATVTPRGRRLLRLALALTLVAGLLTVGWLGLRDSGLTRVRDVEITGVTASDGDQVKQALEGAAREMSTLHVREDALHEAAARFASVRDLRVSTDFPHRMTIRVLERRPVAALVPARGGKRVPVTRDGLVLTGVTAERDLPSLVVKTGMATDRVTDTRARRALRIAAEAPGPLRRRADTLELSARGVTVTLRDGPDLIFGSAEDADQKWRAAARVLAETSSQGATYLDLRVPGRVAAGGLAPITPETENPDPQLQAQDGTDLN